MLDAHHIAVPQKRLLQHFLDVVGRLRAATVCALALAVILAQPVASFTWLAGAHATPEQIALHEEALAHGQADHHDGPASVHAYGGHRVGPAHCRACEADARLGPDLPGGPVFGPAPAPAGPIQDILHGMVSGLPKGARPDGAQRLAPPADLPPPQNFPAVPHRPPVPS
jgi:hypothetical protein